MTELQVQTYVCTYLAMQYRDVLFNGTPYGRYTSAIQASNMKKAGYKKGFPDLFIYEARHGFHGLAIELKTEKGRSSQEQEQWVKDLRAKGYKAEISYGLDATLKLIDEYLGK